MATKVINFFGFRFSLSLIINFYQLFNREKDVQTKKDNYSNVPQPKVYLQGLRGVGRESADGTFKKTNMRKIDLTLDVDLK